MNRFFFYAVISVLWLVSQIKLLVFGPDAKDVAMEAFLRSDQRFKRKRILRLFTLAKISERSGEPSSLLLAAFGQSLLDLQKSAPLPPPNLLLKLRTKKQFKKAETKLWDIIDLIEGMNERQPKSIAGFNEVATYHEVFESLFICLIKQEKYREALNFVGKSFSRRLNNWFVLRRFLLDNVPSEQVRAYFDALLIEEENYTKISPEYLLEKSLDDLRFTLPNIYREETISPTEILTAPAEMNKDDQIEYKNQIESALGFDNENNLKNLELLESNKINEYCKPLDTNEILEIAKNVNKTLILFRATIIGTFIFLIYPDKTFEVITVDSFNDAKFEELMVRGKERNQASGWAIEYYNYRFGAENGKLSWFLQIDETLNLLYLKLFQKVHLAIKRKAEKDKITLHELVIFPSRGLAILPLHAAWWKEGGKKRYLLDEFTISYAHSPYIYKQILQKEKENRSTSKIGLISNPTSDLAHTNAECRAIIDLFKDKQCLILSEKAAKRDAVVKLIEQSNWLHFACHGNYILNAPLRSALYVAPEDSTLQYEKLKLSEIMKMDLSHVQHVVLSACETGMSDFRDLSDDRFDLPFAFLSAGAMSVWGTLWTVDDESTKELMVRAYSNLKNGMTKPQAIRLAQLALRNDQSLNFQHPFFWAGFQHYGV